MAIDFGNIGQMSTYEEYSKKMMQNLLELIEENNRKRIKEENLDPLEYIKSTNGEMTIKICPEPILFLKDITREDTSEKKQLRFEKLCSQIKDEKISKPIENRWLNKTANGINIRLGNLEGDTGYQTPAILGDNCVHGVVVGRTGSGKSVLINNIILNLITEYAPWELDLYLVDMKKVELSRYMKTLEDGSYITPHISACAATSEVRYVVSMIEYLAKAMKARQSLFAALGVQKISDFREKYGVVLPRILLLVDEFQQLFLEASSREKRILDECVTAITKLGRATGVHLLFSSQEMSGALGAKELANFKLRIALPCDETISMAILGNSEAAKIEEKGRTLVNTKGGSKAEDNIMYHTPFINDRDENDTGSEFSRYLYEIYSMAKRCKFTKIQKFYQEDVQDKMDSIRKIKLNTKIREQIKTTLNDNIALIDALVLGTGILYNNSKYDYESVFLEKGKKRNIGIICMKDSDIGNVLKTLSENFRYSDNQYEHTVIYESEILKSVYSTLIADISGYDFETDNNSVIETSYLEFKNIREIDKEIHTIFKNINYDATLKEIMGEFFSLYLKTIDKNEMKLLFQKYKNLDKEYEALSRNAEEIYKNLGKENEVLCKKFEEIYKEFSESNTSIDADEIIKDMNIYFKAQSNKYKKNIEGVKEIEEDYKLMLYNNILFQLLKKFNKYDNKKDVECLNCINILVNSYKNKKYNSGKIKVRWIIGTDNLDKNEDKYLSTIMEECTNNDEIFILAGTNPENLERSYKCCNYVFLNSSDEKMYTKFKMNFTKKNDYNKTMDFKIINYNKERSYKQFYYEFEAKEAPKLNLEEYEG